MEQPKRRSVGRSRSLLLEVGTEELPPKTLKALAESFAMTVFETLLEAGVVEDGKESYRWYATPRRLAVWVGKVKPRQADQVVGRRGPSIQAAFDDSGLPTRAALGFASSCGVPVEELDQKRTDKGEWLVFHQLVAGKRIVDIVEQALQQAIRNLPIARRMRWGDHLWEFVRPAHWLLAMYGSESLKVTAFGLKAGYWTRGHRFQSLRREIRIMSADRYVDTLKRQGGVMVDYEERKQLIQRQVHRVARRNGAHAVMDPALLEEVTGLVEWPQALYGEYDRRFLKVPPEVLISSMRDHQKYFHMTDAKGRLKAGFITVCNAHGRIPQRVRHGNERVLRARLVDAEFFWNNGLAQHPEHRLETLAQVQYHAKLGSVRDKVTRMALLAAEIARQMGVSTEQVQRACELCKTDLVTDMVAEFPELQGIVGSYYADHHGEHHAVSLAIRSHYQPRFAGDTLPHGTVSRCVALADRLDSIAGIFACGEIPTGDRDPYALRRAALGILRILIEKSHDLDLYRLLAQAVAQLQGLDDGLDTSLATVQQAFGFIADRLRSYYLTLGYDALTIAAIEAVCPHSPLDFHRRLMALHGFFTAQPEAARSLASANKRIANILIQQEADEDVAPDPALYREKAERTLATKLDVLGERARKQFIRGRYGQGLTALANLKKPIDRFFDRVMVMDEDPAIRRNRLALLARIRHLFLVAADISVMRVE